MWHIAGRNFFIGPAAIYFRLARVEGAEDSILCIDEDSGLVVDAAGTGRDFFVVYPVHVTTRKSFGLMTRKLSVTKSRHLRQFLGILSRKKSSVASANCTHVA